MGTIDPLSFSVLVKFCGLELDTAAELSALVE